MSVWDSDPRGTLIVIRPASFGVDQRIEASAVAADMGNGVLMEIYSGHTEFYATASVPVGKIHVRACRTYKGMLEDVTTLESADVEFDYPQLEEWMRS